MDMRANNDNLTRCHQVLDDARRRTRPGKVFLEGRVGLSYGELFDRAGRVASYVRQQGLGVDDRAIIISSDDSAVTEIFFGLIAAGVTAVLLNPEGSVDETVSLVRAADASLLFVDDSRFNDVDFGSILKPGSPVIRVLPSATKRTRLFARFTGKRAADSGSAPASYPAILGDYEPCLASDTPIPESTTAYILFTSGTTSRPKGVEITHKSLFAQMDTFVTQYSLDDRSRILNLLPLHHTDGLTHGAVVSLVCGGTLVRPMRFRVDRLPALLDEIYKSRITHFITVPSMLAMIRQFGADYHDAFETEDFKFIISTAAYLDPGLWESLTDLLKVRIVNVYGLTETVCEACYCGPDDDSFRIGTIGKPVDCEVRVVDADGNALAPGQPGELVIKGDNVMKGYFRMPEETAEVLRDGWFHTGDIATIDDDGFVSIVGRKKSVIISGGYNVYPEDVTNVLMRLEGVADAVTVGMPDPTWGERVVSCVIPAKHGDLSASEISKYMSQHVAREKLPRDIYLMEEFPRGPAGKVKLDELRDRIRGLDSGSAPDASAGIADLTTAVADIASSVFKLPANELGPDASPETVAAWNSLAHVEFLMALEIEFGHRFSPRDIMSISNLGQAVDVLQRKVA